MASILTAVRPGYLVVGAAVALGVYAMHGAMHGSEHHVAAPARAPVAVAPQRAAAPPEIVPTADDDDDDVIDESTDEDAEEAMRGLEAIEDPAEFAMVFAVDGTTYMRLSTDVKASSHGTPRLIDEAQGERAVVAAVTKAAMPASLRTWMGRSVVVDGTCTAHVVGFAEVSRVNGEPPGTEDYENAGDGDGEDGVKRSAEPPAWTIDEVRDHGVTLAARLDGCDGTWARASEYPAAAIAHETEEPELQSAALANLLAKADDGSDDEIDHWWKDTGGEGDWRQSDTVAREAHVFVHPLTNEKWIVASAYREGGCGDFSVSRMAVYRVSDSGKLDRVADLDYAGNHIDDVVDLDGDGQPEIVFGGTGSSTTLVDLKNTSADSISVDYVFYGCGC